MDIHTLRKWVAQRDSISILETMDVHTGSRTVLKEFDYVIEAPNWTQDGKTLVYNSKGRLFTFDLASGEIQEMDMGFAIDCNNDHVLSPDNTHIAVSHFTYEDAVSRIYILPFDGGQPEAGDRERPQLPARLVAGRRAPGLLRRAGRAVRYLHHLGQRRPGDPTHQFAGPGRRPRVLARRQAHLVQLHPQRADASVAHGNGRLQPDAHGERGGQLLVPACFARRAVGGVYRLCQG